MPRKIPSGKEWRPHGTQAFEAIEKSIDKERLWRTLADTLPCWEKLDDKARLGLFSSTKATLMQFIADQKDAQTRPRVRTMRANLGRLTKALRAVQAAFDDLDERSRQYLEAAASEIERDGIAPEHASLEQLFSRTAQLSRAVNLGMLWTENAKSHLPRQDIKQATVPSLPRVVRGLGRAYGDANGGRLEVSGKNQPKGFVEFILAVLLLGGCEAKRSLVEAAAAEEMNGRNRIAPSFFVL